MLLNVIDDLIGNGPFEEIHLGNGGFHDGVFVGWNLDAFFATEGIAHFFGIGTELVFVVVIHIEPNGVSIAFDGIDHVVLFCIIRGEPVDDPM